MKNKLFLFYSLAMLLFASVISTGCGSSGSGVQLGATPVLSITNERLAGGWRVDTSANNIVSADIDGTEIGLKIIDFAVYLDNVDVEKTAGTGSLNMMAVAILSSDHLTIPLLLDTKMETRAFSDMTVLGVGSSDSGPVWDFVLSGSAENLSLNICGVSSLLNHSAAFIDVSFKKATPSNSRTDEEMNELLNGTWQTERADSFNTNAGHIFVSSDETFVGEIEPPSDWPTVRGFIPVKVFSQV